MNERQCVLGNHQFFIGVNDPNTALSRVEMRGPSAIGDPAEGGKQTDRTRAKRMAGH